MYNVDNVYLIVEGQKMPENEKQFFIQNYRKEFDADREAAEEAWVQCKLLRETITIDNVPNFINFVNMGTSAKLRWRTKRAEEGIELTPSEVDKYIGLVRYVIETL